MRILLDTNVLLRLADQEHVQHPIVRSAIESLDDRDCEMVIVPQVLYECWVVATRPTDVNGLGVNSSQVDQMVAEWLELFTLLRDERRVFQFWRDLVFRYSVIGKNAHDARLVAAMLRHGVADILTFNATDFSRFSLVRVWTPADIVAGKLPA